MSIEEIEELALEHMNRWGLITNGWSFCFIRTYNTLGLCDHQKKTISFSVKWINLPKEEILDTILHEIAHALAGKNAGHNKVWKKWCKTVGANPTRLYDSQKGSAPHKYTIDCPKCGFTFYRQRKPTTLKWCRRCDPSHAEYLAPENWKLNPNYVQ